MTESRSISVVESAIYLPLFLAFLCSSSSYTPLAALALPLSTSCSLGLVAGGGVGRRVAVSAGCSLLTQPTAEKKKDKRECVRREEVFGAEKGKSMAVDEDNTVQRG